MVRRSNRGGYQAPSSPAASSGPGAFSRRTDGGPANPRPDLEFNAEGHGTRQQFAAQQRAVPDDPATSPPGTGTSSSSGAGGPPVDPVDVFAPTSRPDEPLTSGLADPHGEVDNGDIDILLRLMYQQFPHPDLVEMLHSEMVRSTLPSLGPIPDEPQMGPPMGVNMDQMGAEMADPLSMLMGGMGEAGAMGRAAGGGVGPPEGVDPAAPPEPPAPEPT